MLNLISCIMLIICAALCDDIAYTIIWAFIAGMDFDYFFQSIISKIRED